MMKPLAESTFGTQMSFQRPWAARMNSVSSPMATADKLPADHRAAATATLVQLRRDKCPVFTCFFSRTFHGSSRVNIRQFLGQVFKKLAISSWCNVKRLESSNCPLKNPKNHAKNDAWTSTSSQNSATTIPPKNIVETNITKAIEKMDATIKKHRGEHKIIIVFLRYSQVAAISEAKFHHGPMSINDYKWRRWHVNKAVLPHVYWSRRNAIGHYYIDCSVPRTLHNLHMCFFPRPFSRRRSQMYRFKCP